MFYVGQRVECYKLNGGNPRVGDIGVIKGVYEGNFVDVDFPNQKGWVGGDYCVRPLEEEIDEEVYY